LDNLEGLKELRELNLSYNRLETIENLAKLANLRVLILDHNRITQIQNLKNLRKLEILQVTGNLLEDLYIYGGVTEPMIEIKEI
jgi:N-acetylmuramoyl-L-alanine amidase